ncbi:MAG: DUF4315 family protein [Phocaeicola vulgatus]|nr:DUF4315 family protein [Lachnospiraceae bacterium]MCI6833618.1 DUF4315 family protein [Phocaeicola vulgatus]
MARKRSITKIETEITQIQTEMTKIQAKYDSLAIKLKELQQEKYEWEFSQIMAAYQDSGKSYRELMTFLGA